MNIHRINNSVITAPILFALCITIFYALVIIPLGPIHSDGATYYFTANSVLQYLMHGFSSEALADPSLWSNLHIIPCAPPNPKPLSMLADLFFVALLPHGFSLPGLKNALMAGVLFFVIYATFRKYTAVFSTKDLTVLALCTCLSGLLLMYSKMFTPHFQNILMTAFVLYAHLHFREIPSRKSALIYGICLSAAVLTHPSLIPFAFSIVMVNAFYIKEDLRRFGLSGLFSYIVFALLGFVLPFLIVEGIYRIPLLLINDPTAWHFSALYGFPYQSYFQIWDWYFTLGTRDLGVLTSSLSARIYNMIVLPSVTEGAFVLTAICGWLILVKRSIRHKLNHLDRVLLIAPILTCAWFILQRSIFPAPYAMSPLGLYSVILTFILVDTLLRWSREHRFASRAAVVSVIIIIGLLQAAHIQPLPFSTGPYHELARWAQENDHESIIFARRPNMVEAAGLTTYYPKFSPEPHLASWGLRPETTVDDPSAPKIFGYTEPSNMTADERAFFRSLGMNTTEPLQVFDQAPNHFTFAARAYKLISLFTSPVLPGIGDKFRQLAEIAHNCAESSAVHVYRVQSHQQ